MCRRECFHFALAALQHPRKRSTYRRIAVYDIHDRLGSDAHRHALVVRRADALLALDSRTRRIGIATPSTVGFAQIACEHEAPVEPDSTDRELERSQCAVGTKGTNIGKATLPHDVTQPRHAITAHRRTQEVDEVLALDVRARMPEQSCSPYVHGRDAA